MCEFSQKLVAWIDRELPEAEAAILARHISACAECRGRIGIYRQVSESFDAHCDAAFASRVRSKPPRWIAVASAAAAAVAVAAVILFLLALPSTSRKQPSAPPPTLAGRPPAAAANEPTVVERQRLTVATPKIRRPSVDAPPHPPAAKAAPAKIQIPAQQLQIARSLPSEPAIEIAIPADAMFPPGALPEGVSFVADVTLAPDGSAERLRLQPRLVEFERRPSRP